MGKTWIYTMNTIHTHPAFVKWEKIFGKESVDMCKKALERMFKIKRLNDNHTKKIGDN